MLTKSKSVAFTLLFSIVFPTQFSCIPVDSFSIPIQLSHNFYPESFSYTPLSHPLSTITGFDEPVIFFENNDCSQHFLLFPQCILLHQEQGSPFEKPQVVVCKCFQFGPI